MTNYYPTLFSVEKIKVYLKRCQVIGKTVRLCKKEPKKCKCCFSDSLSYSNTVPKKSSQNVSKVFISMKFLIINFKITPFVAKADP